MTKKLNTIKQGQSSNLSLKPAKSRQQKKMDKIKALKVTLKNLLVSKKACFFLLFAYAHKLVYGLHHQEDAESHDYKVDDRSQKVTEQDVLIAVDRDPEAEACAADTGNERIDDILGESGNDITEGSTDDNADGQIHYVAFKSERLELT